MKFQDLGTIPFTEAFEIQQETVARIRDGRQPETVYLLEHPHIFTTGRGGLEKNLLARQDREGNPIDLQRLNRGGDITYHGPGQLVGYPQLDLRQRGRDVHMHLRMIEEVLIQTVRQFDVSAFREPGRTGVWTRRGKLASIGVGVRQWITMHGFALNVSTDLRYFQMIHPCGIQDCPMTSLEEILGRPVPMAAVKEALMRCFESLVPAPEDSRAALTGTPIE